MTSPITGWQAALAAEHRAVFGYSVLGPHLHGADQALAVACSDAHEQLRDRTEAAIQAAGAVSVPPAADYPDLYPVSSVAAARQLAVRIEDDCAAAWRYAYFVAASASTAQARHVRAVAQTSLSTSAIRGTKWRLVIDPAHATVAFPGI
jgi:hypothetical protein